MVGWLFIAIVLIVIYVVFELMKFKHSFFSIFVIIILFFFLLSLVFVFNGKDVDLNTFGGIKNAGKTYVDWLALSFGNVKNVGGNVVKMDWKDNSTTKPR